MSEWSPPYTSWLTTDGIANSDLNRIELNMSVLRDSVFRKVQGFGYISDVGASWIEILPGSCFSDDFYPMKFTGGKKAFTSHSLGFGSTTGGMAPSVTIASGTWYYIFALGHVSSSDVEIMIDSSPTGANVTLANYPRVRYVGAFRTKEDSAVMSEMYSDGDNTYINPTAAYNAREISFTNASDNVYETLTLLYTGSLYALPAREVRARLNIRSADSSNRVNDLGLISRKADSTGTGLAFTVPTNLYSGGVYQAEVLMGAADATGTSSNTYFWHFDCDILVNSSRQLSIALRTRTGVAGDIEIAVRGFHDERLI